MWTWYLLGAILWAIFVFLPAIIAKKKGYSFLLFFLLSIPFFWATIFVAVILKNKNETAADRAASQAADKALAKEESKA